MKKLFPLPEFPACFNNKFDFVHFSVNFLQIHNLSFLACLQFANKKEEFRLGYFQAARHLRQERNDLVG